MMSTGSLSAPWSGPICRFWSTPARPAKVLLRALSEQPRSSSRCLAQVFKPSEESGVVDPEPEDPEQARAVATQAYGLLDLWGRIPGTRDDGTIDGEVLESVDQGGPRPAKVAGRADIADDRIGNMLSASPKGLDGNWPAEPVREVIDLFRSKPMIERIPNRQVQPPRRHDPRAPRRRRARTSRSSEVPYMGEGNRLRSPPHRQGARQACRMV